MMNSSELDSNLLHDMSNSKLYKRACATDRRIEEDGGREHAEDDGDAGDAGDAGYSRDARDARYTGDGYAVDAVDAGGAKNGYQGEDREIPGEIDGQSLVSDSSSGSTFLRKKHALSELRQYASDGIKTRRFTLENDLDEMIQEIERVKLLKPPDTKEIQAAIKTARRGLLAMVSFIEFVNSKWNPLDLHLQGWGDNVMEQISDYDSVFERLYIKYREKVQMPPELEFLFMVLSSAFMFHISNAFLQNFKMHTNPIPQAPRKVPPKKRSPMAQAARDAEVSEVESDGD
jgi:hypothetical protein